MEEQVGLPIPVIASRASFSRGRHALYKKSSSLSTSKVTSVQQTFCFLVTNNLLEYFLGRIHEILQLISLQAQFFYLSASIRHELPKGFNGTVTSQMVFTSSFVCMTFDILPK